MPSTSRISRRFIAALVAASLIPSATAMAATAPRTDSTPAPAAAQIGIGQAYGPVMVAPAHSASARKAPRPHRASRHRRAGKHQ